MARVSTHTPRCRQNRLLFRAAFGKAAPQPAVFPRQVRLYAAGTMNATNPSPPRIDQVRSAGPAFEQPTIIGSYSSPAANSGSEIPASLAANLYATIDRGEFIRLAQREDLRDDLVTSDAATRESQKIAKEKEIAAKSSTQITADSLDPAFANPYTGTYSGLSSVTNNTINRITTGTGDSQDIKLWSVTAMQTFDYVKNLALPINFAPVNTVILGNDWQYQTSAQVQRRLWGDKESGSDGFDGLLSVGSSYCNATRFECVFCRSGLQPQVQRIDHRSNHLRLYL